MSASAEHAPASPAGRYEKPKLFCDIEKPIFTLSIAVSTGENESTFVWAKMGGKPEIEYSGDPDLLKTALADERNLGAISQACDELKDLERLGLPIPKEFSGSVSFHYGDKISAGTVTNALVRKLLEDGTGKALLYERAAKAGLKPVVPLDAFKGFNYREAEMLFTLSSRAKALCRAPKMTAPWRPGTDLVATKDSLSAYKTALWLAAQEEDPAQAARLKSRAERSFAKSKERGLDPNRAGPEGWSRNLLSLLLDYAEKTGDQQSLCRFGDDLALSILDPAHQRTVSLDGKALPANSVSITSILDAFEAKLSGDNQIAFQKARERHALTRAEFLPQESAYQHSMSQLNGTMIRHSDKAHDKPTDYIAMFSEKVPSPSLHHNQARDGFVVTRDTELAASAKDPAAAIRADNERHTYTTTRSMHHYDYYFDYGLVPELAKLGNAGHLIDMGSGEGFFLEGLVTGKGLDNDEKLKPLKDRVAEQLPRGTGVTIQMKRPHPAPENPRLRYFVSYLDKVSDEELLGAKDAPKADMITDIYGVYSYDADITSLWERYFRLLKPEGKIYIFSDKKETVVTQKDGTEIPFIDFVRQHAEEIGVKIEESKLGGVILSRRPGTELKIPKVKLEKSVNGNPPARFYSLAP